MFVTKNQLLVFIACIAFGGCFGVFFGFADFSKKLIRNKIVNIFINIISFILMGILFVYYAYYMYFPSFRAYMPIGVCLGVVLYVNF